jgi:hypothetical protein
MTFKYKTTTQERENMLLWLKEGVSYTEISKRLEGKLTKQRIKQIALKHNIDAFKIQQTRKNKEYTDKMFAKNIEFGDLEFPSHCPVLGLELDYFTEGKGRLENSVSFDRVDPTKGYIKGNVIVMSWRANRIKNDGTAQEHQQIATFMLSY